MGFDERQEKEPRDSDLQYGEEERSKAVTEREAAKEKFTKIVR